MIQVRATPQFMRMANKIMTSEALQELIDSLAMEPSQGALMKGTGGIRKIRCRTGKDNKGKRGGARVLYYYDQNTLILLITLYRKSDKENLDAEEKNELKKLLPELIRRYENE